LVYSRDKLAYFVYKTLTQTLTINKLIKLIAIHLLNPWINISRRLAEVFDGDY